MNKKTILSGAVLSAGIVCNGAQSRPNFLILLTDDQRLNTLGVYDADCPIETPNIDRLALVGNKGWEKGLSVFSKPFTAASVRYFNITEMDEAKTWVEEGG